VVRHWRVERLLRLLLRLLRLLLPPLLLVLL
jgi:hypothetical protein